MAPEPTPSHGLTAGRSVSRQVGDVACLTGSAPRCWLLADGRLHPLDPGTLAIGDPIEVPGLEAYAILDPREEGLFVQGQQDGGWVRVPVDLEEGTLGEPIPIPVAPPRETLGTNPAEGREQWGAARTQGWRMPFLSRQPGLEGGMILYQRGGEEGTLVHVGRPMFSVPAPGSEAPATYPPTLAYAPDLSALYLIRWPTDSLLAMDPRSLATRWTIDLAPAAHGLFVTPGGRYLLAAEGGELDMNRLLDFDEVGPLAPGEDPAADIPLRRRERPPAARTVVVDTAVPSVIAVVQGDYRRWIPLPGGAVLLVTSRGVIRLEPPTS